MPRTLCKWFLAESWGWRRFLADCLIGAVSSPFRLLWVIWWIALGVALAHRLERFYGLSQWVGAPLSIALVLLIVWAFSLGRLLLFFPFPPCRRGKCRSMDAYTWVMGRLYGQEKWSTYHYWCKCGDEYIRESKRFLQVLPDGTRQTYMKLVGFRKWQPESAKQNSADGVGDGQKQASTLRG